MFLLDEPSGYCVVQVLVPFMSCLLHASLYHLALISGERYIAMKHPFAYTTMVTEARLLAASASAWLLSVILHILLAVHKTTFALILNLFVSLSIFFIVFCHVTVYRETRRHEQQLAAQQVTQEAREQFEKDKKALKLTSVILGALAVCYIPLGTFAIIAVRYQSKISLETVYIFFSSVTSIVLLNSLVNPVIYSVRMRQFRVAFIELTCRTVNITEAEEIEKRVFGAPNAVVMLQEGEELERPDQQNAEEALNVNSENHNSDILPVHDNCVVEQPNADNHYVLCTASLPHSL